MRSKWRKYVLLLAAALCGAYTGGMSRGVFAQESAQTQEMSKSETEDLKWRLKQMEEAVLRQQEQIQAIRNRLEPVGPEVTKVAKEEIEQAIDDYLSTDEARKKMGLGLPSLTAVYTPDDDKYSLSIKSPDSNYSFNLGGRMQFRYTYKDNDENFPKTSGSDKQDIALRRARLYMGGNIYSKYVHYYVELDADKFTFGMRDFYVYWTPIGDDLNFKLGYFKVPFNRQRMVTSGKLLFQDRSIANDAFTQDRDYGLDIYGKVLGEDNKVEYHAAVFQGAGQDPTKLAGGDNLDNKLLYVLSLRYNPFGAYDYYTDETDVKYSKKLKATIGASVAYGAKDKDVKLLNTDTIAGVVDMGVKYRGLSWNTEYFERTEDQNGGGKNKKANGFYTQAGYFVIPKKLEVAARYSMVDPDKDVAGDIQKEYTCGLNYYFRDHRSKIQADFGDFVTSSNNPAIKDVSGVDMKEKRIRLQYQIMF